MENSKNAESFEQSQESAEVVQQDVQQGAVLGVEAMPPTRRADGMPVGRVFVRGHSGNPRGRPKGIKAAAQRRVGENGEKAIDAIWRIASNPLNSDRLRLEALTVLLDRGFGRPAQTMAVEGGSELKPLIITTFGGRYKESGALEPYTAPASVPRAENYSALAGAQYEPQEEPQTAPAPPVKAEPVAKAPAPVIGMAVEWLT